MTSRVRIIVAVCDDATCDVELQAGLLDVADDRDAIAELAERAPNPEAAVAYYALTADLEVPAKVTIREVEARVEALKEPGR